MVPDPDPKDPPAKKTSWTKKSADMQFLLQWLTTEGNYVKYQGKHNNGLSKKLVAAKLAEEINKLGNFNRTGKDIQNKIAYIITKFKEVHTSINQTGSGVKGQGTLEAEIKKSCYFYFDLLPILGSRSGILPPATNEKSTYYDSQKIQSRKAAPQGTSNEVTVVTTTTNIDDDSYDNDDTNAAPEVPSLSSKPKENLLERLGTINTPHSASVQVHGGGTGSYSKSKVVERAKQIELETEKLRSAAQETEKKRQKKLELDIEVTEIEKRTKLAAEEEMKKDKEVKEVATFVQLLNHYNELKKTYTDEKIVSMFPWMKKFCSQSEE